MRKSEIHEPKVQMVDHVAFERIFLVIESHEDDIEGIDDVDTEDRCDGGDFSPRYDGECGDHEGKKHASAIARKKVSSGMVKAPEDDDRRKEYREDEEYELRIFLRREGRIDEIEFRREHSDDEEGDAAEPRCHSWYRVAPVQGIHDEDVPDDRKEKWDDKHGDARYLETELIEVENTAEDITDVANLDARDTDECSDTDLHDESEKRRDPKWTLPEDMKSIQETYQDDESSTHENDDEFAVGEITECEGDEEKIDIECRSDFERERRFSFFMRIFMRLVHESYLSIESHDEKEYDRKNHSRSKREDRARSDKIGCLGERKGERHGRNVSV